jgi:hypothetical protein
METESENYLSSTKKQFRYYKFIGDRATVQLTEVQMHWCYNHESNRIILVG